MHRVNPIALLSAVPVVPVLAIEHVRQAVPLARALAAGGLTVLEITLRTPAALDVIRAIGTECPDVVVGAGTLLKTQDVAAAIKAGAKFLVSPGTPSSLADALAESSVPALPGCATTSEAMTLADRGFRAMKFFPAMASGGVQWLSSIAGPLPELRFCPTGGITRGNALEFLKLPNVICVGGSWVAPKDVLAAGDFGQITKLARDAFALRRAA